MRSTSRDVTRNWIGSEKMSSQSCNMNFSAFNVIIRKVYWGNNNTFSCDKQQRAKWVSVKHGNRNDRIRNGNDQHRKWLRNFPHKFKILAILCRKLGGHFRFRPFPFQIRSFLFPFFTEIRAQTLSTCFFIKTIWPSVLRYLLMFTFAKKVEIYSHINMPCFSGTSLAINRWI